MRETMYNPELSFTIKNLPGLSAPELWEIMHLRQQVFILEQKCLYPDMDAYDTEAWHVLMQDDEKKLIGTARILLPGKKYREASIGRIAVSEKYRGLSIGKTLTRHCIEQCLLIYPQAGIRISAQHRLKNFYQELGFSEVTEPYDEDGILHVDMVYVASAS